MPQMIDLDRARGCFLGMAVGDALGAPLEGLSPQQIQSHYGLVTDYVDGVRAWKRKPYRWRLPGLYSDDTQQALVLADCLLRFQKIDTNWITKMYLAMARPRGLYLGAHRGLGRSFRLILESLERGASPQETGTETAGIGAAMRIAPLGLFHAGSDEDPLDDLLGASLMTHRDIRSLAGASAVVSAVRRLARGEPRTPSLIFRLAADVARAETRIASDAERLGVLVGNYRSAISTAIAGVEPLLECSRDQALAALVEQANRQGAEPYCRRATQGFPPALIPTCLYLFFTTDRFEEALIDVINLGGDADTSGAILGAWTGAYYGETDIPARWLEQLQNREGIQLRAEALARRATDGLPEIPDLIATEHQLTEAEAARRDESMAERQGTNGGDLGANRRF